MPKLPSPFLPYPHLHRGYATTPEINAKALAETGAEIVAIRDLLRANDLPVACFDAVAQIFVRNQHGFLMMEVDRLENLRNKKIEKLEEILRPRDANGYQIPVGRGMSPAGGLGDYVQRFGLGQGDPSMELWSKLSNMSGEELDAELAKRATGG